DLGDLRFGQRCFGRVELRAGIHHRRVKEEREEFIAEVIVRLHHAKLRLQRRGCIFHAEKLTESIRYWNPISGMMGCAGGRGDRAGAAAHAPIILTWKETSCSGTFSSLRLLYWLR